MRGKFQEKLLSELSTPLVTMLLWPEILVPYFAVKKTARQVKMYSIEWTHKLKL